MAHFQRNASCATLSVPILTIIHTPGGKGILVIRCQVGAVVRKTIVGTFLRVKRDVLQLFLASFSLSAELESNRHCGSVVGDLAFNDGLSERNKVSGDSDWCGAR